MRRSPASWPRTALTLSCALVAAPVFVPRQRLRIGGGGGGYEEVGACEETQFRKYATAVAIYERDLTERQTLRLHLQYFQETGDDLPTAAWGLLSAVDWRMRWRYVGVGAGLGIAGIVRHESPPPAGSSGTADSNHLWPVFHAHLELGPRWLHWYGALNPGPTLYLGDAPFQLATGVGARYGRAGVFIAPAGSGGEIAAAIPLTSTYAIWAQIYGGRSSGDEHEPLYGGLVGLEFRLATGAD